MARIGLDIIAGRYEVIGADRGIVLDVEAGLEWMRCSLRQTSDGSICSGSARLHSFDQAQTAAKHLNDGGGYAGPSGWRVPSIEELRTLVYCSGREPAYFKNNDSPCSGTYAIPTIVQKAFPNAWSEYAYFWSRSTGANGSGNAWLVSFNHGSAFYRSDGSFVRLVRSGQ